LSMTNVLAGDVGGTSTRLGVFDWTSPRPRARVVRTFRTLDFSGLPEMIAAFLDSSTTSAASIASACFGVAGPVAGEIADLTNVPWHVDAGSVGRTFGLPRVDLLNDLEALAYALPVLVDSEVRVLQAGHAVSKGSIAVIAAGTGLGEAVLHWTDGRYRAHAMEAGHADFAARGDRDVAVLRDLSRRRGRASVEDVISGPGLTNIYRALHGRGCTAGIDIDSASASEAISTAALGGGCRGCTEALETFVDAYGAEAGNLALRSIATGGVFIGGGIAPKILPALEAGRFMAAFRAKAPFETMLSAMPVKVILNSDAGLLGAANFCLLSGQERHRREENPPPM
jgi:glucokinase